MLVATHMAAAAALYRLSSVRSLPTPVKWAAVPAVLVLSFASHFALDAIPHRELHMTGNTALGLLVIAYLFYIAWRDRDVLVLAAGFLGALPDVMWVLDASPAFNEIHSKLHFHGVRVPFYMLFVEIAGLFALTVLIYRKSRLGRAQ